MDSLFVNVPSNIHAPPQTPLPLAQSWNAILDHDDYDDDIHQSTKKDDPKQVRRRSSKACDQCRKSKCKCERPGARDEPCKNCVLLGTPCTFLGPSRKRGPPKGYIDAIESRLHQMEALLGTLLSADDHRARSLLDDLAGDPLARDILDRVDESPFGTRGKLADAAEDRAARILRTSAAPGPRAFPFASPSSEWQAHLKDRLRAGAHRLPRLQTDFGGLSAASADAASPSQRRRLSPRHPLSASSHSHSHSHSPASPESESDSDDLASAVGQLSLNEDSQVRYHGKVSGLHILGQSDRLDKRNEGGLWRFPRAGVWPRATPGEPEPEFPTEAAQLELLDLYFAYVHPVLPLMQEAHFWRDFRADGGPRTPRRLLLAMFAIAARYRRTPDLPLPPTEGDMWNAGDEFLEHAKRLLNETYASSRPSTCQALLLLSYREVGIGAMAQAWLYVGMAVRMAQDLGMHRSAEKWQRTGAALFSEPERQLRKRIWYACVVMDKYVSTYIGRPLSIFERDFDTPYPGEDPAEESALWAPHPTVCPGDDEALPGSGYKPAPARLISCFNASARLSSILSTIVETIYSVHPPHAAHDALLLEQRLDRWFIELPPHLMLPCRSGESVSLSECAGGDVGGEGGPSCETAKEGNCVPPPHVWTLHMQYWCAVLLLHRPFMRRKLHSTGQTAAEAEAACRKAFDMCAMAATKISNTVAKYMEHFCIQRCAAFLTYYVFSASIMHMTTLSVRPIDVQAGQGLQRCMDALQKMHVVWPSAGRAWELVHGAKIDMREVDLARRQHEKRKRAELEDEDQQSQQRQQEVQPREQLDEDQAVQLMDLQPEPEGTESFSWGFGYGSGLDDVLLAFSPKDVWRDFSMPEVEGPFAQDGGDGEGYGLPMMPGTGPGPVVQPFMGEFASLYTNNVPHTNRDAVPSDAAF